MYKEINKLFNIILPVKTDKEIAEKQLNTQTKNSVELTKKVTLLKEILKRYSIEEYLKIKSNYIQSVISFIKDTNLYNEYNNGDFDFLKGKYQKPRNQVIHFMKNKGIEKYYFIQIDVIEGNFNTLKRFKEKYSTIELDKNSKSYVDSDSYSELVDKIFKDIDFDEDILNLLKSSKSVRQVIFGNLNPKRNDKFLNSIVSDIEDKLSFDYEIIIRSQDEVVYAIPYSNINKDLISKLEKIKNEYPVRFELIDYKIIDDIKSITENESKKYYIEEKLDIYEISERHLTFTIKSKKLKGVPSKKYLPLYRRYIMNEDLTEVDKIFEEDGNLYQLYIKEKNEKENIWFF